MSCRILFICHDFPPYRYAGAQLFAQYLAKELNRSGLAQVEILHPTMRGESNRYEITSAEFDGLKVHRLNKEKSYWGDHYLIHPKVSELLTTFLRKNHFDLIHFHGFGQMSLAPIAVARALKIPTVATLHEFWFLCPEWHLLDQEGNFCPGPDHHRCTPCHGARLANAAQPPSVQELVNYLELRKLSMQEAWRLLDLKIVPSQFQKHLFDAHGFHGAQVLPNGWIFPSPKPKIAHEGIHFGFVGRLSRRKGLEQAIRAFRNISEPSARLFLHGKFEPKKYDAEMRSLAGEDSRIVFAGAYTPDDLADIFSNLDAALIPSLMDNVPLSVQEALSQGVPVIASDAGGIPELFQPGVSGLQVSAGDVESLTMAMNSLILDRALLERLQNGISPIKTITDNSREYVTLYSTLLPTIQPPSATPAKATLSPPQRIQQPPLSNHTPAPVSAPSSSRRYKVQFYLYKNVHWPMYEALYRSLRTNPEIEEIVFCIPHLNLWTSNLETRHIEDLLQEEGVIVRRPDERPVDITFIADSIGGKLRGCGKVVGVGHGTISKGYYFTDSVWIGRENEADMLCVPGPFAQEILSRQLQIPVVGTGLPKLDPVFQGKFSKQEVCAKLGLDPSLPLVLYAPTFNKNLSSLWYIAEEIGTLALPGRNVIAKLHNSTDVQFWEHFRDLQKHNPNFRLAEDPDLSPYLAAADLMISDVSSAMMEFMILDKPVVLFDSPDWDKYHGFNPEEIEYKWREFAYRTHNIAEMETAVERGLTHPEELSVLRKKYAAMLVGDHRGDSCSAVWNACKQLVNGSICGTAPHHVHSVIVPLLPGEAFCDRSLLRLDTETCVAIELLLVGNRNQPFGKALLEYCKNLPFHSIRWIDSAATTHEALFAEALPHASGHYTLYLRPYVMVNRNAPYLLALALEQSSLPGVRIPVSVEPHTGLQYKNWAQNLEIDTADIPQTHYLLQKKFGIRSEPIHPDGIEPDMLLGRTAELRAAFALATQWSEVFRSLPPAAVPGALCSGPGPGVRSTIRKVAPWFSDAHLESQGGEALVQLAQMLPSSLLADYMLLKLPTGTAQIAQAHLLVNCLFSQWYMDESHGEQHLKQHGSAFAPKLLRYWAAVAAIRNQLLERRARPNYTTPATSPLALGNTPVLPIESRPAIAPASEIPSRQVPQTPLLSGRPRITLFALRELHLPVLEPVYRELASLTEFDVGFTAPMFQPGNGNIPEEGLRPETIQRLVNQGIPFWGNRPVGGKPFACVVTADACVDRIEGWGPVVCCGHGTISKNLYFIANAFARRESHHAALCVPGPWYVKSFGGVAHTHVIPTGFPKMDEYAHPGAGASLRAGLELRSGVQVVLFAPTYNPEFSGMDILSEVWGQLNPQRWQVLVKLHGAASEAHRNLYRRICAQHPHMHWIESDSVAAALLAADIVVSDVSSVALEAYALDKPVVVVDNPAMQGFPLYNPNAVEFQVRDAAHRIRSASELPTILEMLRNGDPLAQKRRAYARELFPANDGRNSQRVAEVVNQVAAGAISRERIFPFRTIAIPASSKCQATLKANLARRHWPSPLQDPDQLDVGPLSTPLLLLTGEHLLPHQWDVVLDLHFAWNAPSDPTGPMFGTLPRNLMQQSHLVLGQRLDIPEEALQAQLKSFRVGESREAATLLTDGLWIPAGVEAALVRRLLRQPFDVDTRHGFLQSLRAAGRKPRIAVSLYGMEPIREPGNR